MALSPLEIQNCCITDWSDPKVVKIDFFKPHFSIAALSHRWAVDRLTEDVTVQRTDGESWDCKVDPKLRENILQLLGEKSYVGVFMDQLCINQKNEKEKNAQIQMMGQIFNECTTVICAENGTGGYPAEDSEYWTRAWTQQEFSFSRVDFSIWPEDHEQIVDLVWKTFRLNEEFHPMFHIARDGRCWRVSEEIWRLNAPIENDALDEVTKQPFLDLWKSIENRKWYSDGEDSIKAAIKKLRRECGWNGSNRMPMILHELPSFQCAFPKDQLYGSFGSIYFSMKEKFLNYNDPEEAYQQVLELHGIKFYKRFGDGDPFGLRYKCSGFWVHNTWDWKPESIEIQNVKVLDREVQFFDSKVYVAVHYEDKIGFGFPDENDPSRVHVIGAIDVDSFMGITFYRKRAIRKLLNVYIHYWEFAQDLPEWVEKIKPRMESPGTDFVTVYG